MNVLKIIVYGKVQGVWFRKYTQKKAIELNLIGFVTNRKDGTVYIEVANSPVGINLFLKWLENEGSPLSKVSKIKTITCNKKINFNEFKII